MDDVNRCRYGFLALKIYNSIIEVAVAGGKLLKS